MNEQSYVSYKESLKSKAKPKRKKKNKIKKIKSKGKTNANKVAKKLLKESLNNEFQIQLTVDGDTIYYAGSIIELDLSFGKFSGKYFVDKVTHNITGDYECEIEAHKLQADKKEGVNNARYN